MYELIISNQQCVIRRYDPQQASPADAQELASLDMTAINAALMRLNQPLLSTALVYRVDIPNPNAAEHALIQHLLQQGNVVITTQAKQHTPQSALSPMQINAAVVTATTETPSVDTTPARLEIVYFNFLNLLKNNRIHDKKSFATCISQIKEISGTLLLNPTDGTHVMHALAELGTAQQLNWLLELEPELVINNIDIKQSNFVTPLYHAACTGDPAKINFFVNQGANPYQTTRYGMTPLSVVANNAAVAQCYAGTDGIFKNPGVAVTCLKAMLQKPIDRSNINTSNFDNGRPEILGVPYKQSITCGYDTALTSAVWRQHSLPADHPDQPLLCATIQYLKNSGANINAELPFSHNNERPRILSYYAAHYALCKFVLASRLFQSNPHDIKTLGEIKEKILTAITPLFSHLNLNTSDLFNFLIAPMQQLNNPSLITRIQAMICFFESCIKQHTAILMTPNNNSFLPLHLCAIGDGAIPAFTFSCLMQNQAVQLSPHPQHVAPPEPAAATVASTSHAKTTTIFQHPTCRSTAGMFTPSKSSTDNLRRSQRKRKATNDEEADATQPKKK